MHDYENDAGKPKPPTTCEPAGILDSQRHTPPAAMLYKQDANISVYVTHKDITNEKRSATKGAVCRTVFENHPARALAGGEDAIDMIHHHTERGKKKERGPAPKTEPEPDYDAEGMIPSN